MEVATIEGLLIGLFTILGVTGMCCCGWCYKSSRNLKKSNSNQDLVSTNPIQTQDEEQCALPPTPETKV